METRTSILKLVAPKTYFTKIAPEHQKYLKFCHGNDLYQFTCLSNGYCHGARGFTKSLKPPLSALCLDGNTIAASSDDCINMNRSSQECWENTKQIIQTFQSLDFTVHPESKSMLHPSQKIEFSGFMLNSVTMTRTFTDEKKRQLKPFCTNILLATTTNIRTIASVLGKITSSFPAAKFGRLQYRGLERYKTEALFKDRGNYSAKTSLTDEAKHDLIWWRDNITNIYNNIVIFNPDMCIRTDAPPMFGR